MDIQVICATCRDTMKLEGQDEHGNATFTCPKCGTSVVVRLRKERTQ